MLQYAHRVLVDMGIELAFNTRISHSIKPIFLSYFIIVMKLFSLGYVQHVQHVLSMGI